jgi:hypothetical protein
MDRIEEEEFIKKELAWCEKMRDEKYLDLCLAQKKYDEALLRVRITEKALEDFYGAD